MNRQKTLRDMELNLWGGKLFTALSPFHADTEENNFQYCEGCEEHKNGNCKKVGEGHIFSEPVALGVTAAPFLVFIGTILTA